jgi:hypothetical protein
MTSVQVPRTEATVFRDEHTTDRVAVCRGCDWRASKQKPIDTDQAAHAHAMETGHVVGVRNDYHRTTETGVVRA